MAAFLLFLFGLLVHLAVPPEVVRSRVNVLKIELDTPKWITSGGTAQSGSGLRDWIYPNLYHHGWYKQVYFAGKLHRINSINKNT